MEWDLFGIPNSESPSRVLGMGIFHFGLDQKFHEDLKSRGWGLGIWDPQKSPVKDPQKIPNRMFLNRGIFIPGIGEFSKSEDFYPLGLRIFSNLEIFIPGIGDF